MSSVIESVSYRGLNSTGSISDHSEALQGGREQHLQQHRDPEADEQAASVSVLAGLSRATRLPSTWWSGGSTPRSSRSNLIQTSMQPWPSKVATFDASLAVKYRASL